MRYAGFNPEDVGNGDGVRVSLFVQGCDHHCKGCFNPETWGWDGGKEYTEEVEDEILRACGKPYVRGLSILGGEPISTQNVECVTKLCKRFKQMYPQKDIWVWTGNQFCNDAELKGKYNGYGVFSSEDENIVTDITKYIDHIVDGRFVERLKDLKLKYRGSSNQRVFHKINDKWELDTTV